MLPRPPADGRLFETDNRHFFTAEVFKWQLLVLTPIPDRSQGPVEDMTELLLGPIIFKYVWHR